MDMDTIVVKIISVVAEAAAVVDTGPAEDVAAIVVLLALLIFLLVLLPLLKDVVLLDIKVLSFQVMVADKVVMLFAPLVV